MFNKQVENQVECLDWMATEGLPELVRGNMYRKPPYDHVWNWGINPQVI